MDTSTLPPAKTSAFLKWTLILGITIVLNLFFAYAIQVFYREPQFNDFCKQEQVNIVPDTKDKCVAQGGQWTEDPNYQPKPVAPDGRIVKGYCNLYFTCQKDFDDAHKVYNRNIFVALVALGILSIIAGFLLTMSEAVSLGFSFGGVLSLIIATIRYWSDMDDKLRVVVLGVALVVLIYLGIKKFKS